MDYKDLPLDKRMEMASQYALLLVADNKLTPEIIDILKNDFALTEEQAAQAVGAMRKNYKNEYDSNVRNNFLKALGALGVSLMAFLFYYFIGKEMGSAGTFFIIVAVLFGLGGVGALLGMGSIIGDRFTRPAAAPKKVNTSEPKQVGSVAQHLYAWTGICGFMLSIFAYLYFYRVDIIEENNITTVHNCIITEPVKRKHTSGKNRSYYYVLKFRSNNLEYRFFQTYYKYSNAASLVAELKEWDTVSIQVNNEDLHLLQDKYSTQEVEIVNLGRNGNFWVNHKYRNVQIEKMHKNCFYVCLIIFVALVAAIFMRTSTKDHYRR